MTPSVSDAPRFPAGDAAAATQAIFGVTGAAAPLPSERDQNFLITDARGNRFVLKIANASEEASILDYQNRAMEHVARHAPTLAVPRLHRTPGGEELAQVTGADHRPHFVRLLSFVPGTPLAHVRPHAPALLRSLGRRLAEMGRALEGFEHPAMHRRFHWDLTRTLDARVHLPLIADDGRRALVERVLDLFAREGAPALGERRSQVIHNDWNDHNVLVGQRAGAQEVIGAIDFGDLVHAPVVCDLAVALAYAMLGRPDPLAAGAHVLEGFHEVVRLDEADLSILAPLVCARLALSVLIAARQRSLAPENTYLDISQDEAWPLLAQLMATPADAFREAFGRAIQPGTPQAPPRDPTILGTRRSVIGPSLSVSYREPLTIVRGFMQHLYDDRGREYLDAVNNVAHVGHSHPRVVGAVADQLAVLNTNTRYLHPLLGEYAGRLTALMPAPLSVCFFVNSGSEANELALRLARTHTNRVGVIVVDGAYHGNTTSLVEISPYKGEGPGGRGLPPHVRKVPMPDVYRGAHRDEGAGARYASYVAEAARALERAGAPAGAFFCESLLSCGGQIVLPPGYLQAAAAHARAAGALVVADEVQVGFGRVGSHFWGFETQGVVPDIVTLGKPIGNGFPLGAVVTRPEIAASFANGMEFFSTFGGSTASCAAGLAVLDVIRDDDLQHHAARTGAHLMGRLRDLQSRHGLVGDVRGLGLFIGVELVGDRDRRDPAGAQADEVVNRLRRRGVLVSTDGPHHNVLKIKPPMVFTSCDADRLATQLDEVLAEIPPP